MKIKIILLTVVITNLLTSCGSVITQKGAYRSSKNGGRRLLDVVQENQARVNDKRHCDSLTKKAYSEGFVNGYSAKVEEISTFQYNKGYTAGKNFIEDSFLLVSNTTNEYLEKYKRAIKREVTDSIKKSFELYYEQKFQLYLDSGYKMGLKENFRHSLFEPKEKVQVTKIDFRPLINFQHFYDKVKQLNGNPTNDKPIYEELVNEFYYELIEYLESSLNMTEYEKTLLKKEYNSISPKILEGNFKLYQRLYNQSIPNREYEYSYFSNYHTTEIVTASINATVCTVAQILVSFVKVNPLIGFSLGQGVSALCELVIPMGVGLFEDELKKYALFQELNQIKGQIVEETDSLVSQIVFIQKNRIDLDTKTVTTPFLFFFSLEASMKMEVLTSVKYGFEMTEFNVIFDHEQEKIIVVMPDKLKIVSFDQAYKILEMDDSNFADLIEVNFLNSYFEILRKKIRLDAEQQAYSPELKALAKAQVKILLRQIYKPLWIMTGARYEIVFNYGSDSEALYIKEKKGR